MYFLLTREKNNLLHYAVETGSSGSAEMVDLLLSKKLNPNTTNKGGYSAFDFALHPHTGHSISPKIIKSLLAAGARVDK